MTQVIAPLGGSRVVSCPHRTAGKNGASDLAMENGAADRGPASLLALAELQSSSARRWLVAMYTREESQDTVPGNSSAAVSQPPAAY